MDNKTKLLVMADGNCIHTEKWIYGLCLKNDFDVYLLSMNPKGIREGIQKIVKDKNIYKVFAGGISDKGDNYNYLRNVHRIFSIVRNLNPDIISTVYLTSYGFLGALAKGDAILSHFMIGSDIMVTPFKNRVYRWLTKYALSKGDLFVSSSRTMTKKLLELADIPIERLLTQQYGVGEEVVCFHNLEKKHDFISNRAWVPNSNIPMILEIFSRIDLPVTLALIGGNGPQQEKNIKNILAPLTHVEHLGVLPYMENIEAVAKSKFYISLTSSDGASLSLMEAMAVGAVPVVSDIEPNHEWIENGVNGFTIDLNDLDGAVGKIREIALLPESILEPMRERNRMIILERGRLVTNMGRFANKLMGIVAQRSNT